MPNINLDVDYFDHIKTIRLIGLLGRGADVLPLRIWCRAGKHHPENGKLTAYSTQEIESLAGWWGKEGSMVEAMHTVGFLDKVRGGYKVHGWEEREGHLKAFKERASTAARARWAKIKGDASKHASSMPQAMPQRCIAVHGSTKPLTLEDNGASRPHQPVDKHLVDEIVSYCSDEKSRGNFISLIHKHGEPLVREAFGELRMHVNEGQGIENRGAYITGLLRSWASEKTPQGAVS